ncbi:MAG: tRNA 2-selenouridine(34) synthase MnmH [Caulobacterales bacterium 32-69-10]|nr:MAG: tRNA 2-selenouridine(34) synthase MnmH [Caulobacterales bacterium 32-69-10]
MSAIETIDTVDAQSLARFDAVIDVRSPSEFAEDHAPGAVNLPVLDDEERARVGTIYVQESPFLARRLGAALVARNIARHLETALADKEKSFRPLVYCWRGGQRSNAMATILSQVGWRAGLVAGGYKTYRRRVVSELYDAVLPHRLILLDGDTGSGKTDILKLAAIRGVQVVDLEGLAAHRGSLFGGIPGTPQPSQKMFESRLLAAFEGLDPSRPVLVEAESSKIGERFVPPAVWAAMATAPRIELQASAAERAAYLVRVYADMVADPAETDRLLQRLPRTMARVHIETWRAQAAAGEFAALAEGLLTEHYDPAYRRSTRDEARPQLGAVTLPSLDEPNLAVAADRVAALIGSAP